MTVSWHSTRLVNEQDTSRYTVTLAGSINATTFLAASPLLNPRLDNISSSNDDYHQQQGIIFNRSLVVSRSVCSTLLNGNSSYHNALAAHPPHLIHTFLTQCLHVRNAKVVEVRNIENDHLQRRIAIKPQRRLGRSRVYSRKTSQTGKDKRTMTVDKVVVEVESSLDEQKWRTAQMGGDVVVRGRDRNLEACTC